MWKIQHLGLIFDDTTTYCVISDDSYPSTLLKAPDQSCKRKKSESQRSPPLSSFASSSFFCFNTHNKYNSTARLITSSPTLYTENLSSSS
jgi:hypothetical protein